jgi:hypothetical protein
MNKYLIKIAKETELENPSYLRMAGKGALYGAAMTLPGVDTVLGTVHGARSSYANQVKENDGNPPANPSFGRMVGKGLLYGALGSLPVVGTGMGIYHGVQSSKANQLEEQEAKKKKELKKEAQLVSDQAKKDIVGTGTIAALGGLGTLAAHKMLPHSASAGKVMAVGTGIGLVADYAGLKLSNAYNKRVDMKKSAELLEKIALNALARNVLDSKRTNLSASPGSAMAGGNAAGVAALSRGGDQMKAISKAVHAPSSSGLAKSVSSGGADVLATTSIKDRLAARRGTLGLAAANGDKTKQIDNALALREGKASGKIGGELSTKGSGMAGSTNAQNINKAMVDAKAGHRAHLTVDSLTHGAAVKSTAPMAKIAPAAAKMGLLDKAKGLLKTPLGKKLGIGAGLVGAGALAHKIMAKPSEPQYM